MKKKLSLIAVATLSLFLVACGDKQSTTSAPAVPAPAPMANTQPAAPGAVTAAPSDAPASTAAAPVDTAPAAPVAVFGGSATSAAPASSGGMASVSDTAIGKGVYGKACALCHAAGVAGAPKPGDKDAWATRVAQGKETLYKHAIEGYTGDKGMMPARGGNSKLTDEEVKAAVDFMADQSI